MPLFSRPRTGPLIVFVHVPKAAGTTVNRHLKSWSRAGIAHAERFHADPGKLARRLPHLDWISGHLDLEKFETLLAQTTDRPLRYFGTIRDPAAHVAAQYNWQIEIFHRGKRFYNAHPQGIRDISERIRATDNSDPVEIIANLKADPGLFLNLQSRFLLGDEIDLEGPDADTRRARYEMIAPLDGLGALLAAMTGRPARMGERSNESRYHVDRDLFTKPPISDFLRRNNRHDQRLYADIAN